MPGLIERPAAKPSIGIVTVARDRREHLAQQFRSIAQQSTPPSRHVVVDLGGDPIGPIADNTGVDVTVVHGPRNGPVPIAAARNLGASAVATDVMVFLDVDCLCAPHLVDDYVRRAGVHPGLWCGPVGYLPEMSPQSYWAPHGSLRTDALALRSEYHTGRPSIGQSDHRVADWDMFWSLSFAVDVGTWERIGGFDERFVGYGAEDTDFAFNARRVGVELWHTGAAQTFHQHHPVSRPPIEHLDDICRNATRFHDKWGTWPMLGWLRAFADMGAIEWDEAGSTLKRLPRRHDVAR